VTGWELGLGPLKLRVQTHITTKVSQWGRPGGKETRGEGYSLPWDEKEKKRVLYWAQEVSAQKRLSKIVQRGGGDGGKRATVKWETLTGKARLNLYQKKKKPESIPSHRGPITKESA